MLPAMARNQSSAVPVISIPSRPIFFTLALTASGPPVAARHRSVAVLSLTTSIIQAMSRSVKVAAA